MIVTRRMITSIFPLKLIVCVLCLVNLGGLTACSRFPPPDPNKQPPNLEELPSYPNEQQLAIQDIPQANKWMQRIITFQSTDKPDKIMAFYQDALIKNGFTLIGEPLPERLILDWGNGVGQPAYRAVVDVTTINLHSVSVKITLTKYDPE